jgi:PAS domain S-box-containing protein
LLRLLVPAIEDFAVFVIDLGGTNVSWNPGVGRLFGYEEAEFIGSDASIIFTPEDRERGASRAEMEQAAREGRAEDERWHLRKDGTRFWASGLLMSLRDESGELRGFAKIVRDATERKRAEDYLLLGKNFSDATIDSLPGIFYMFDTKGRFIRWNRNFEQVTGHDCSGIAAMKLLDLFEGEDRRLVAERVADVFREGHANVEATLVTKDGRRIPHFFTGSRLNFEGRECVVGMGVDLTEQRRAQQEVARLLESEQAARREAEEATRLKDEFLATLSHELRTPLTAVLGWARLLRSGSLDEASAARAVEAIERNAVAQKQLIEDVLDVSRIITGKLRLNVQRVKMVSVVEAAVDTVKPAADAKGVRLLVHMPPDVGVVNGDPERLQQVVWNLLSNSVKFTPEGGLVEISLRREASGLSVSVRDTGQGIAPEFLPYVFERFRQADQQITRRHAGLGLGLAIARHLIELHGGTVRVESEGRGHGATFTVTLPPAALVPGQTPEAASEGAWPVASQPFAESSCPPSLEGLRVLAVDDEPDTLEYVRMVLENCGAHVVTAGSAAEALRAADADWPDLLVSDIGMAQMSGFELIRRLRDSGRERGRQLPAVAITAYAREEDRRQVIRAGYQTHLPKPFEPADLIAAVASLAGRFY